MNKVILYLSSYVPLYFILIIKNVLIKLENRGWNISDIKFFNTIDDWVLIVLILLTIISLTFVSIILSKIKEYHQNRYRVIKVNGTSNDSVLNYISIYILTFIDFNMNSISNIATLVFIMILLGIISINYDELYVNPTLLIIWNYRIYNITINRNGKGRDLIVLVQGNLNEVNMKLDIYESTKQYTFAQIVREEDS